MNIYKSKNEYQNMPLPENLENLVEMSIKKAESNQRATGKIKWKKQLKVASMAVVVMFMLLVLVSNISPEFAMAASKVPVLGQLVRIITWQDYEEKNDTRVLNVRMPQIENADEDNLENRINNEIRVKISNVLDEAEERAKEYKQAYLDTGGKEEKWHPMEIYIDYYVKCNNSNILSFIIEKSESYASVYTEKYYYNIDLETGKDLSLRDLLGPDYIEKANRIIKASIEERVANGEMFFGYGTDDFKEHKFETISDETKFYVNEDEKVVIVFDKYEIAAGYMGFVEFIIE